MGQAAAALGSLRWCAGGGCAEPFAKYVLNDASCRSRCLDGKLCDTEIVTEHVDPSSSSSSEDEGLGEASLALDSSGLRIYIKEPCPPSRP